MILLDSSLIVAYYNKVDQNHAISRDILRRIDGGEFGTPVITDHVFDESVTVILARTGSIPMSKRLGEILLDSTFMIRIGPEAFSLAWKRFSKRTWQAELHGMHEHSRVRAGRHIEYRHL
jgi:predicted nucleic acid-binding protein